MLKLYLLKYCVRLNQIRKLISKDTTFIKKNMRHSSHKLLVENFKNFYYVIAGRRCECVTCMLAHDEIYETFFNRKCNVFQI